MKKLFLLIFLVSVLLLSAPVFSHCWKEPYDCKKIPVNCRKIIVDERCYPKTICKGGYVSYCKEWKEKCVKYSYYRCNCRPRSSCRPRITTVRYTCCKSYGRYCYRYCRWRIRIWRFSFCLSWGKVCYSYCRSWGTCTRRIIRKECKTIYVCSTCSKCVKKKKYCVEYGKKWDKCAFKETIEFCDKIYDERCDYRTVCKYKILCDKKPGIFLEKERISPGEAIKIKINNLEYPIKARIRALISGAGKAKIIDKIIDRPTYEIYLNNFNPGVYPLQIEVWDLSDDPSYDHSVLEREIEIYAEPLIQIKICNKNSCSRISDGVLVNTSQFTLKILANYTDSFEVFIDGKEIGKGISYFEKRIELGPGEHNLRILAHNYWGTKEIEYSIINRIYKSIPLVPAPGNRGEFNSGAPVSIKASILISGAALPALAYLGINGLRGINSKNPLQNSGAGKANILLLREKFIKRAHPRSSLASRIKRKLKLKLSFLIYSNVYRLWGKEYVNDLKQRFGGIALEVLRKAPPDKEFVEFILRNKLYYFLNWEFLYGFHKRINREEAITILRIGNLCGFDRRFISFLIENKILSYLNSVPARNILDLYTCFRKYGPTGTLNRIRRFGLRKVISGIFDSRSRRIRKRVERIIGIERKIYEDKDGSVVWKWNPSEGGKIIAEGSGKDFVPYFLSKDSENLPRDLKDLAEIYRENYSIKEANGKEIIEKDGTGWVLEDIYVMTKLLKEKRYNILKNFKEYFDFKVGLYLSALQEKQKEIYRKLEEKARKEIGLSPNELRNILIASLFPSNPFLVFMPNPDFNRLYGKIRGWDECKRLEEISRNIFILSKGIALARIVDRASKAGVSPKVIEAIEKLNEVSIYLTPIGFLPGLGIIDDITDLTYLVLDFWISVRAKEKENALIDLGFIGATLGSIFIFGGVGEIGKLRFIKKITKIGKKLGVSDELIDALKKYIAKHADEISELIRIGSKSDETAEFIAELVFKTVKSGDELGDVLGIVNRIVKEEGGIEALQKLNKVIRIPTNIKTALIKLNSISQEIGWDLAVQVIRKFRSPSLKTVTDLETLVSHLLKKIERKGGRNVREIIKEALEREIKLEKKSLLEALLERGIESSEEGKIFEILSSVSLEEDILDVMHEFGKPKITEVDIITSTRIIEIKGTGKTLEKFEENIENFRTGKKRLDTWLDNLIGDLNEKIKGVKEVKRIGTQQERELLKGKTLTLGIPEPIVEILRQKKAIVREELDELIALLEKENAKEILVFDPYLGKKAYFIPIKELV